MWFASRRRLSRVDKVARHEVRLNTSFCAPVTSSASLGVPLSSFETPRPGLRTQSHDPMSRRTPRWAPLRRRERHIAQRESDPFLVPPSRAPPTSSHKTTVDGHGDRVVCPEQTWRLERLACDPLTVYAQALRCPIRLVMVRSVPAEARSYVADMLREASVPRLKLSLEMSAGLGVLDFPRAWRDADATLVRLGWADLPDLLTHRRLAIKTGVCCHTHWPAACSEDLVRAVSEWAFHFAGAAAALVPALPSLRYLLLATVRRPYDYDERNDTVRGVYGEWCAARGSRVTESEPSSNDLGIQEGQHEPPRDAPRGLELEGMVQRLFTLLIEFGAIYRAFW
ncbi:hypothetical protein V8D89_009844, partial [Ganoderma adspersum]